MLSWVERVGEQALYLRECPCARVKVRVPDFLLLQGSTGSLVDLYGKLYSP